MWFEIHWTAKTETCPIFVIYVKIIQELLATSVFNSRIAKYWTIQSIVIIVVKNVALFLSPLDYFLWIYQMFFRLIFSSFSSVAATPNITFAFLCQYYILLFISSIPYVIQVNWKKIGIYWNSIGNECNSNGRQRALEHVEIYILCIFFVYRQQMNRKSNKHTDRLLLVLFAKQL